MRARRIILGVVLVVVALAFQISVLPRLHLPGAVPDVVLLVVIAFALTSGPMTGCVTGFLAGLAVDVVPPADHAIGREAFTLCLIGYLVGLVRTEALQNLPVALITATLASAFSTLVYTGLGMLLRESSLRHLGLGELVLTGMLYEAVLAAVTLPFLLVRSRRRVRSASRVRTADMTTLVLRK